MSTFQYNINCSFAVETSKIYASNHLFTTRSTLVRRRRSKWQSTKIYESLGRCKKHKNKTDFSCTTPTSLCDNFKKL